MNSSSSACVCVGWALDTQLLREKPDTTLATLVTLGGAGMLMTRFIQHMCLDQNTKTTTTCQIMCYANCYVKVKILSMATVKYSIKHNFWEYI